MNIIRQQLLNEIKKIDEKRGFIGSHGEEYMDEFNLQLFLEKYRKEKGAQNV